MGKVDAKKYVVLDIESNGLSSINNDLLSISIYKPDDEKKYDRFLPLELEEVVWPWITDINGITNEMVENQLPLTQEELDWIIREFDLENRLILHYGRIDETFIKNYLKRKKILGFEKLHFFNFKHNIISNKFSEGNITKDNLCRIYGIGNIKKVHSGLNDCILEWKLFEKMNDNKLIVIRNDVYEFNEDYIIPASYLQNYPNFKYHISNYPNIDYEKEEIKTFRINSPKIKKFDTNISGITIEHLINSMLNVEDKTIESFQFMVDNKNKLNKIGVLPSNIYEMPIIMNNDGTITALNKDDESLVNEINSVTEILKREIKPLIDYIKNDIFDNKPIMSQELVINREDNVMAKCDLSSKDKIMEIKTFNTDVDRVKYQLYYESMGREIYILETFWHTTLNKGLKFVIYKVIPYVKETIRKRNKEDIKKRKKEFEKKLKNEYLEVVSYTNIDSPIKMRCKICGNEWITSYNKIRNNPICIFCNDCIERKEKHVVRVMSTEEKNENRKMKYQQKISERSNNNITIIKYYGAKEKLTAKCNICGNEWKIRADHLLERTYCPKCRYK